MKPAFLLTAVIFFLCMPMVRAQQQAEKKERMFSFNVTMSDYSFLKTVKDSSLSNAIQQKDWLKPGNKSFGIGASFWKGLTTHIDFSGTFTATLANFPANFVKGDSVGQATFSTQLDALLHFKLLKDRATVNPFLTAGIGAGDFPKQFAAYAPVGTGLQFHLNDGTYIIVQAQWRIALTPGISNDYLQYSLGFAQNAKMKRGAKKTVVKKEIPAAQAPLAIIDTDGDGVPDATDKCPTEKGTLNGCPDSDNDGVADKDDKCPNVPGVARYNGCPVPDTDNDGVNDEEDRCPKVPGVKENHGCPLIIDTIKATLNDTTRYMVYFEPGKSNLHSEGFAVLSQVVKQLKENNRLTAVCNGHTDNTGNVAANYNRSLSRAQVCADYISSFYISKDRITVMAFGNTKPVADLSDPLLQWKNRRVEILVVEKK